MTLSGAIIRAMWQMAGHRGLDTEELRVRIGASESYWKALLMFNGDFHVSLLEKMAEALGVTATQLVTTAEELMAEERRARRPMESAILKAMMERYGSNEPFMESSRIDTDEMLLHPDTEWWRFKARLKAERPNPYSDEFKGSWDVTKPKPPGRILFGAARTSREDNPWVFGFDRAIGPSRHVTHEIDTKAMAMNECDPRIEEMMAAAAEPWSTAHAEEPGGGEDHGRA